MNINEAYKILEVDETISDEDLKKTYRKLQFRYHPDKDNSKEAEEKSKQINAAYSYIKEYRENPSKFENHHVDYSESPFNDINQTFINNIMSDFFTFKQAVPIKTFIKISFAESVLGCTKQITYNRNMPCNECNAQGVFKSENKCTQCDGQGFLFTKLKNNVKIKQNCSVCLTSGFNLIKCKDCNGTKVKQKNQILKVNIPAGVTSGQYVKLSNVGHFVNHSLNGSIYGQVLLQVDVEKSDMKIEGSDVISTLSVSLFEALNGCSKEVNTVLGNQKIEIPALSKHKDIIELKKFGVAKQGSHKFILDIFYPKDKIKEIIDILKE